MAFVNRTNQDITTKWNTQTADSGVFFAEEFNRIYENFRAIARVIPPVGSIVAVARGYFSASNLSENTGGSFRSQSQTKSDVEGNSSPETLQGGSAGCWKLCDNSTLYDTESVFFNVAGRRLPALTDDRFLMGDRDAGNSGGSNTITPTSVSFSSFNTRVLSSWSMFGNDTNPVADDESPYIGALNGGLRIRDAVGPLDGEDERIDHMVFSIKKNFTHSLSVAGGGTENRPKYLTCFYFIRVK